VEISSHKLIFKRDFYVHSSFLHIPFPVVE
jgi:hypothetical protein